MEALQMLKFDFKKNRLSFVRNAPLNQHILLEDDPDEAGSMGIWVDGPDQSGVIDDLILRACEEERKELDSHLVLIDPWMYIWHISC